LKGFSVLESLWLLRLLFVGYNGLLVASKSFETWCSESA
jgi:hypothetical protein